MLNNYTSKTRAQLTTAGFSEKTVNALTDIEVILLGETIRRPQSPVKVSTRYAAEILCLTSKGLINHEFNSNLQCFECSLPETKPAATTETTNKPATRESKLNYTLAQIEDTTGILPGVIASRIVWDKLDNESETLTGEQIEAIENEFTAYAENKFVNVFNTNARFRKMCARVESIDDLSAIYQYLESWFEGWHKRQAKRQDQPRGTKQPLARYYSQALNKLVTIPN